MPRGAQDPEKVFADLRKRWAAVEAAERPLRAQWAKLRSSTAVMSLEEFCVKNLGHRWPRPREITGGDNVWEVARSEAAELDFAERALQAYAAYLSGDRKG